MSPPECKTPRDESRGVVVDLDQQLLPDQGLAGLSPAGAGVVAAGAASPGPGAGVVAGASPGPAAGGGVTGLAGSSGFAHPAAVKASPASASTANDVFMMQIPSKVKLGHPPSGKPALREYEEPVRIQTLRPVRPVGAAHEHSLTGGP